MYMCVRKHAVNDILVFTVSYITRNHYSTETRNIHDIMIVCMYVLYDNSSMYTNNRHKYVVYASIQRLISLSLFLHTSTVL